MSSVSDVKKQFEKILTERNDLSNCFTDLDNKIGVLKELFENIVKTHGHKGYVFGIDSFCFQNRLIETDIDNLKSIFKMIDGRIYCEYYNLYNQVKKYGKEAMKGQKTLNNNFEQSYPPYKHLDKDAVYDINIIIDMQLSVISCLNDLEMFLTSKEQEVKTDEQQSILGLNIDNLVYTEMFNNAILKARIEMFYKYLDAFHEHHHKYYSRLLIKVKMQIGIVNQDIQLKQFGPPEKASDLKGMFGIKTENSPVAHMDDTEEATLKSYVNYEDMSGSRRNVLDSIIQSASDSDSSRSANGTPRVMKETRPLVNTDDEDDSTLESVEDVNKVVVNETHEDTITINKDESVSVAVGDNEDVAIEADVESIENNNIPEESEIASTIGEHTCQFSEEDIGKRCMVEGYDCIGTVRFVGMHVNENIMRIGIELDEAIGKNNGTVRDHKYFECDANKGVLTAPRKVSLVDGESL